MKWISILILFFTVSTASMRSGPWGDDHIHDFIDPNKVKGEIAGVYFVRAGQGFGNSCEGVSIDDDGDVIEVNLIPEPGASLIVYPEDPNGAIPWQLDYRWQEEGIKYIYVQTIENPAMSEYGGESWLTYIYNVAPRNRTPRMIPGRCVPLTDD